jgi:hypothetical protein
MSLFFSSVTVGRPFLELPQNHYLARFGFYITVISPV